jgi:hypothetical protein
VPASGSYDGVRIWDAVTGKEPQKVQAHTNTTSELAFSPDSKILASASGTSRSSSGTRTRARNSAVGPQRGCRHGHRPLTRRQDPGDRQPRFHAPIVGLRPRQGACPGNQGRHARHRRGLWLTARPSPLPPRTDAADVGRGDRPRAAAGKGGLTGGVGDGVLGRWQVIGAMCDDGSLHLFDAANSRTSARPPQSQCRARDGAE